MLLCGALIGNAVHHFLPIFVAGRHCLFVMAVCVALFVARLRSSMTNPWQKSAIRIIGASSDPLSPATYGRAGQGGSTSH